MLPVRQAADPHSRERVPQSVRAAAPQLLLRYYVVTLPPLAAVGRVEVDAASLVAFEYGELPAPKLIGSPCPPGLALRRLRIRAGGSVLDQGVGSPVFLRQQVLCLFVLALPVVAVPDVAEIRLAHDHDAPEMMSAMAHMTMTTTNPTNHTLYQVGRFIRTVSRSWLVSRPGRTRPGSPQPRRTETLS